MRMVYLEISRKEKGFTFLELLLVLSVVTILAAIIIPVGEKWIRTTVEEDAIHALIATIHSMQSYSIAHKTATKIEFIKMGGITKYRTSDRGEIMSETFLPEGMRVSSSSNLDSIQFHPNGNIANFGSITLFTKAGLIELKFQFQRGRVIISESKRLFMAGVDTNSRHTCRHLRNASTARYKIDIGIA